MTPRWLREAGRLAAEHGRTRTASAVERLAAGRERQSWRVAVVGAAGAGKSTLVYRLLGRDPLPGMELVEAPWDPAGPPSEAVTDTDAVLLAMPATGVWGAAQSRLVEDAVAAHVTSLAVVVTMLDRLGAAERGRVLTYINARVGRVVLLSGPGPTADDPARTALRSYLVDSAPAADRARLRARRIAAQVADQCTAMATSATETIADARRVHSGQTRDPDARTPEDRRRDSVRARLSARQLALIGRVGDQLRTERTATLSRLETAMSQANNPRSWWRVDLPGLLRAELAAAAERTETLIRATVTDDLTWLESELDSTPWRPAEPSLRVEEAHPLAEIVASGPGERVPIPHPGDSVGTLAATVEQATTLLINRTWTLLAATYEPLFTDLATKQAESATARATSHQDNDRVDWHRLARAATALAGAINAALRSA